MPEPIVGTWTQRRAPGVEQWQRVWRERMLAAADAERCAGAGTESGLSVVSKSDLLGTAVWFLCGYILFVKLNYKLFGIGTAFSAPFVVDAHYFLFSV